MNEVNKLNIKISGYLSIILGIGYLLFYFNYLFIGKIKVAWYYEHSIFMTILLIFLAVSTIFIFITLKQVLNSIYQHSQSNIYINIFIFLAFATAILVIGAILGLFRVSPHNIYKYNSLFTKIEYVYFAFIFLVNYNYMASLKRMNNTKTNRYIKIYAFTHAAILSSLIIEAVLVVKLEDFFSAIARILLGFLLLRTLTDIEDMEVESYIESQK